MQLDQLYKKTGADFETGLKNYETNREILAEHDDAMLEFVTLYNLARKYQMAYDTIMTHTFRPWEGAEGRISGQYKTALVGMAKTALAEAMPEKAEKLLEKALEYPLNLGEGRLEGTKDNHIYYYLGIINKKLGKEEKAKICFEKAEAGEDEPAGVMYYYDQPADMILYKGLANLGLGDIAEASRQFEQALVYDYNHQNCRIYLKMTKSLEYEKIGHMSNEFIICTNE